MDDKRVEAQHVMRAEKIDHPSHYGGDTTYEHIKVARAWGLVGNAFLYNCTRYICRVGKKDGANPLEDLRKARWYLNKEIDRIEERKNLDNLLSHPFDGSDNVDRCAYELSPGIYCEQPLSKHRAVQDARPREATCEELDCDETGHSPHCSKTPRRPLKRR